MGVMKTNFGGKASQRHKGRNLCNYAGKDNSYGSAKEEKVRG